LSSSVATIAIALIDDAGDVCDIANGELSPASWSYTTGASGVIKGVSAINSSVDHSVEGIG